MIDLSRPFIATSFATPIGGQYLDVGVDVDTSAPDPFRAASNLLKAVTGFSEARAQAELNWYSIDRGIPLTYLVGNNLVWDLKKEVVAYGSRREPTRSDLELDREFHRVFLEAGQMPVRFMNQIYRQEGLLPYGGVDTSRSNRERWSK